MVENHRVLAWLEILVEVFFLGLSSWCRAETGTTITLCGFLPYVSISLKKPTNDGWAVISWPVFTFLNSTVKMMAERSLDGLFFQCVQIKKRPSNDFIAIISWLLLNKPTNDGSAVINWPLLNKPTNDGWAVIRWPVYLDWFFEPCVRTYRIMLSMYNNMVESLFVYFPSDLP